MNLLKIVKEYIHANPNSKKISRVFWQILSLKNSFAKTSSALKPRHTARILGGQNPKKKNVLSIFRKNRARANPKSKEHFFFLGLPSEARRWRGFLGAYGAVSSHHARRACDIICFGNRCEFGTIQTQSNYTTASGTLSSIEASIIAPLLPFLMSKTNSPASPAGRLFLTETETIPPFMIPFEIMREAIGFSILF